MVMTTKSNDDESDCYEGEYDDNVGDGNEVEHHQIFYSALKQVMMQIAKNNDNEDDENQEQDYDDDEEDAV